MPELKELTDKIQNTWEQMKAKNDEVLTEAKKYGEVRAEDKEILSKMSNALDEQKKQLDGSARREQDAGTTLDEHGNPVQNKDKA